jgi:hypothetical protein
MKMARLGTKKYWQQMLDQQQEWVNERGGSLDGYIKFYSPFGRTIDNITDIFNADMNWLWQLEKRAGIAPDSVGRRWCVRICTDDSHIAGVRINYIEPAFLTCLENAGLGKVHDTDRDGYTFDLHAPKSYSNARTRQWAEMNAERIKSFGFNAAAAPEWDVYKTAKYCFCGGSFLRINESNTSSRRRCNRCGKTIIQKKRKGAGRKIATPMVVINSSKGERK